MRISDWSSYVCSSYLFQNRGSAFDQFPPAPLVPVHAGLRVRRHGAHALRLRPRHGEGLSLLFLRRRVAAAESAMTGLRFELLATHGRARRGRLHTAHGIVNTPAFMPVGTAGTVKGMMPESVGATGAEILLGNTYHLMLRPPAARVAPFGGLHRFMNWTGQILDRKTGGTGKSGVIM